MKATPRKGAECEEKWLKIFGPHPLEVEHAPELDGRPRLRVVLKCRG